MREEFSDVFTPLSEERTKTKIRNFSYAFQPITAQQEGIRFSDLGRTGTKAENRPIKLQ